MKPNVSPTTLPSTSLPAAWPKIDIEACRPLQLRLGGCNACANSCAHDAIHIDPNGAALSAACTGCGRCVPACPMGAIEARNFPAPSALAADKANPSEQIRIECARVPIKASSGAALRVPCLGGLGVDWLIAAHAATGQGPALIDRGLCPTCPESQGAEFAAASSLEQARDLLESMGVAPSQLPHRLRDESFDAAATAALAQHGNNEAPVSRRGFFGKIGRQVGRQFIGLTPPKDTEALPVSLLHPPRPSKARLALLGACLELAHQRKLPMPFGLFRAARIASNCCDRGLCAAICPTGALRREASTNSEQGGQIVELRFASLDCINCGLCVKACPEHAFALDERMDEGWRTSELLKRFAQRECICCGREFTALDHESTCLPCSRSRDLVRDVFHQLFPDFHTTQKTPAAAELTHTAAIRSEEE